MFQVSWRPKLCLSPGCINTQITRALRKKQRLYRKARRSGTDKSWARLKRHRRSVDRHKRRRHREFISNVYEPCWKRTTQSPSGIILNHWIGMLLEFQCWKLFLATLLHPLSLKQTLKTDRACKLKINKGMYIWMVYHVDKVFCSANTWFLGVLHRGLHGVGLPFLSSPYTFITINILKINNGGFGLYLSLTGR